jgi:serine/threonine-protein kinase PknG
VQNQRIASVPGVELFGNSLQAGSLRKGIEQSLRAMAHLVAEDEEKIRLVDLANQVRPKTLF